MAKPIGDITLESSDTLYANLLGVAGFTESPDGPARIIEPGSPDVAYNGTFSATSGTEDDAWPDSGDPYFEGTGTTNGRYYQWARNVLGGASLPFSIGIIMRPNNTTPGYVFALYDNSDYTNCYIRLNCHNLSSFGTRIYVKDGTTETIYQKTGSGQYPVDTVTALLLEFTDDGSGNVDIACYKDGSDLAGTQDTNNAVWSTMASVFDYTTLGGALPLSNTYVNADMMFFGVWDAILTTTLRNKFFDDFEYGTTHGYNLFVEPPGTRVGTGALAGVDANMIQLESGVVAPMFYRGPGLSMPTAPRIGVNAAGRGINRGIR